MKRIYIAGKITGECGTPELMEKCCRKFDSYALKNILKEWDFNNTGVFIHNKDGDACYTHGFLINRKLINSGTGDWKQYMANDISTLVTCDEAHFLPCWQDSKGARIEHQICLDLKIPIVYADQSDKLNAVEEISIAGEMANAWSDGAYTGEPSSFCKGEKCSVCGKDATRKIGEEILPDDPMPNRHNLTNYVCEYHFNMVLRPYKVKPTETSGKIIVEFTPPQEDANYSDNYLATITHGDGSYTCAEGKTKLAAFNELMVLMSYKIAADSGIKLSPTAQLSNDAPEFLRQNVALLAYKVAMDWVMDNKLSLFNRDDFRNGYYTAYCDAMRDYHEARQSSEK